MVGEQPELGVGNPEKGGQRDDGSGNGELGVPERGIFGRYLDWDGVKQLGPGQHTC
jgi:hypothetical protein